jgi:phosphate starvation-inducible PhoH-like protein
MNVEEHQTLDFENTEISGLDTNGIKKGRKQIKNKIQFNISLNGEQKEVKASILQDTVSVLTGKAGSGKTLLATQISLEYLFYREVERIIITRPTVSDEDIGFLPGDIKEKMDPWVSPIYANMYALSGKPKIDKMVGENVIEIAPISFMRGRTFVNSCVIVDEAQNITRSQMEMILTRLGVNSKMMICGDASQSDLKNKKNSGFPYLLEMSNTIKGLNIYELKTNHRHPIVDDILDYFNELDKK